jgi:hypothetical protein
MAVFVPHVAHEVMQVGHQIVQGERAIPLALGVRTAGGFDSDRPHRW